MSKYKSLLFCTVCAVFVCAMSLMIFAGCSGKNYTYEEFQKLYSSYVANNTLSSTNHNSIFVDGLIFVNYSNPKMREAIEGTGVDDFRLKFTRLSNKGGSNQAVFEPALRASNIIMYRYISSTPNKAIPVNRVNGLVAKLAVLDDKTDNFVFNLIKYETRGDDFDKNSAIDQSFLKQLLDSYYDLLLASCSLSTDFADIVNLYFANDLSDSDAGRLSPGKIERYYLTQMAQLVDTYVRFDLATFYNESAIVGGEEYFTSKQPAIGINSMLSIYESYQTELVEFENRYNNGAMSEGEKAIVSAYKTAVAYDTMYQPAYDLAKLSLGRIGDLTVDLDEKYNPASASQSHRALVAQFVQNEFHNKVYYQFVILNSVRNLA